MSATSANVISSTLIATTSQPRSLLSIAKLNMARSRARPSIWSLVRIDQTCLVAAAASPRSPCPCSKELAYGAWGLHSLDPAWPYSSVTEASSMCLALQLLFLRGSESMGNHDSKIVDAGSVD